MRQVASLVLMATLAVAPALALAQGAHPDSFRFERHLSTLERHRTKRAAHMLLSPNDTTPTPDHAHRNPYYNSPANLTEPQESAPRHLYWVLQPSAIRTDGGSGVGATGGYISNDGNWDVLAGYNHKHIRGVGDAEQILAIADWNIPMHQGMQLGLELQGVRTATLANNQGTDSSATFEGGYTFSPALRKSSDGKHIVGPSTVTLLGNVAYGRSEGDAGRVDGGVFGVALSYTPYDTPLELRFDYVCPSALSGEDYSAYLKYAFSRTVFAKGLVGKGGTAAIKIGFKF